MSISGIQTGVKTSVEFVSMQFSSSSQTNGCRNNQGMQFNDQQVQDALSRLSQAFNPTGNASNEAQSPDSQEGANPIKSLLEQIVSLLQGLKGGDNQTPATQPQNDSSDNGGNFLEKMLTAPLDMAKSLLGGLFGGGCDDKGGGGGGIGGLLGGLFGGGGGGGIGGLLGGLFGGK